MAQRLASVQEGGDWPGGRLLARRLVFVQEVGFWPGDWLLSRRVETGKEGEVLHQLGRRGSPNLGFSFIPR